jgi:hypothetical protein
MGALHQLLDGALMVAEKLDVTEVLPSVGGL